MSRNSPPKNDASDRDAIMARRALFLSTALAALSCGPKETVSEPQASASSVVKTTTTTATTATTTTTGPSAKVKPLAPWADVMAKAPPRGVAKGVEGPEKQRLEGQDSAFESQYATIKAVWEKVPACDAADPSCRPSWRDLGERAKAMYDATRVSSFSGFRGCGGASGGTGTVVGRSEAHRAYMASLIAELETHLGSVAASFSPQGEQEWRKLETNAKQPPPMPCLSPCAMPEVQELSDTLVFGKDVSALVATDAAVKAKLDNIVAVYKSNRRPSAIVVRGHADAKESNPADLANARAKAVADWLKANGVPKDKVTVKSFAADLPVRRSDDPSASANSRVDFEAVPQ